MAWVVFGVVAAIALLVAMVLKRARRSRALRRSFGPEYGHVVASEGDAGAAEAELHRRQKRHQAFDIRPLTPEAQAGYAVRWQDLQSRLAERPASVLIEADRLIGEAMRDRGYPVEDFEQRAADISVDHPDAVEAYRAARRTALVARTRDTSAGDVRQAMDAYRSLFERLVEPERAPAETTP